MVTEQTLLDRFLSCECTPYVRQLLEEAIADPAVHRRLCEFNITDVTIDRDVGVVELVDVLSPPEAPRERILLADFAAALARSTAR